jgi:hypothetical protein
MLVLEGFQAGLSWYIVLSKREAFRRAFAGFDAEAVAAFGESDVERLLADGEIIRNRLKILATITNARVCFGHSGGVRLLRPLPDELHPGGPRGEPYGRVSRALGAERRGLQRPAQAGHEVRGHRDRLQLSPVRRDHQRPRTGLLRDEELLPE